MRVFKATLAAATLVAVPGAANAALIGSLGGGTGPFLSLTSAGLSGGTVATLAGGSVYTTDQVFAAMPAGPVFQDSFLAAGVTAGQVATLSFGGAIDYLSFLWGSPDSFNRLTVNTDRASYAFDVAALGFAERSGDQNVSQYVQFAASGGETIRSLVFTNLGAQDAFEIANFSVQQAASAVPEPATWATMILGFGLIAGRLRARRGSRHGAVVTA